MDDRRHRDEAPTPVCCRCGNKGWLEYRIIVTGVILLACECAVGRAMVKAERERDERFVQYAGSAPADVIRAALGEAQR